MNIEICFSPVLYPYYTNNKEDRIVIIADIFRASSTICTALNNGANRILPVATIKEAKEYKAKGFLVGAERNVRRCSFADFGNSPFEYTKEKVNGKDIVLTTSNCTKAIEKAVDSSYLIIGSFLNITAVANFCIKKQKDVLVLCAGWNNRFNIEDAAFSGALTKKLVTKNSSYTATSDTARAVLSLWKNAEPDMWNYISRSEHIKRLEAYNLEGSIAYCLTEDVIDCVPIYDKAAKSLAFYKRD